MLRYSWFVTSPAPFPWHALRRVSRGETRAVRQLGVAFAGVSLVAVSRAGTEILGHATRVRVRSRALVPQAPAPRGGPSFGLETPHGRAQLQLDAELVLAAVGALAGQKTLPRVALGREVPDEVAGAGAGILQWLARAVGVEAELAMGRSLRGEVAVFELAVEVGALRGQGRLCVEVPEIAVPARSDVLVRLDATPLTVRILGYRGFAPGGLLARLAVGDVLVVDPCPAVLVGRVAFAAEPLPPENGRRRVRLGGALAAGPPPSEGRSPMADTDEPGATVEMAALPPHAGEPRAPELAQALAELPLEVQIELGTATMTARAWSSFAIGDVLVVDQRVGEPVALRVSGRLIGRGELVEVDGAVGVRITERVV
ncbi:MAG: FliM/FliN family flagellar motor switch protein [Myxococcales bacterium]|nr:FliM/FliN family flagellar motor switch protein [Myxococcales bacterium]